MKKILSSLIMFSMIFSLIGTISFNFGAKEALALSPAIVDLGSAGDYAVLAKTAITTTGTSSVTGDVGISPALSSNTSGFALALDGSGTFATSSQVTGDVYAADYAEPTPTTLTNAVSDMQAAYTDANSRATTVLNAGAGNLASLNLVAGVYTFDGSGDVSISDDVTLTGNASDVWIFKIPGTLNISAGKEVVLSGGAISSNVFWAVAGTTSLNAGSTFIGTILAGPGASTIAMENGATLNGRALSQTDVTLIANIVSEKLVTSEPPTSAKVTIVKYIDDAMATADSADNTAFSMHAIFPGGEGDYDLDADGFNNPNPYYATTADMPMGSDYSTYENMNDTVGTSCDTTPYILSGYSTGNTLVEAIAGTQSMTTPVFTDLSSDKFVIVWNTDCANVEPPMCEADESSTTYVSDTTTMKDANPTVAVPMPYHANWTANIPGATWIWGEHPLASYVNETNETFTKTFIITGTPTDSELMIAADNSYEVLLNGEALCADTSNTSFSTADTCAIPASKLITGTNTIEFKVKNEAFVNGTEALNPAGLLYKLTINENSCEDEEVIEDTATIMAHKIICPSENLLPDWSGTETDINPTTIQSFLDENPTCHEADWTFEWSKWIGTEGPWTEFTGSTKIPVDAEILVREVTDTDYIPFSNDTEAPYDNNVSAEFYCHTDVVHYDNLEDINPTVKDATYHCVGFNVLIESNQCVDDTNTMTYYSDVTTTEGGDASVLLPTPVNGGWGASIPGASWIWDEYPMTDGDLDKVVTFEKNFTVSGTPTGGNLMIAADNSYEVLLNGEALCADTNENNFTDGYNDTCVINTNMLESGLNTLTVKVKNMSTGGPSNPAGLLYKLTINENGCEPEMPVIIVEEVQNSSNNNGGGSSGSSRRSRGNNGTGGEGQVLGAATDLCNLSIDTYMRVGYQNNPDQVQTLKNFLNWYMNSGLIVNGIYDLITANAVSAFQMKHADKILTPWGLTGPTGIFYKTTLVEAKNKMCPEVILPIPTNLINWSLNQNQVPSKI